MKHRPLVGLDGLERDIAKLNNAAIQWQKSAEMQEARDRPISFHNLTNIAVESCRDTNYEGAAYLAGHVLTVSLWLNLILIVGGIAVAVL